MTLINPVSLTGDLFLLHTTGESEAEVEVLQRVILVRGAGAGQRQTGDLAAQSVSLLPVQGAVGPGFFPSNEAGVM